MFNPIERWIKESDVDGRGICFEFKDSDIPILRDAIRQEIKQELKKAEQLAQKKHNDFCDKLKKEIIDNNVFEIPLDNSLKINRIIDQLNHNNSK